MPAIPKPRVLLWTSHAKAKMHFYKLSEGRVRRVLQTPRRTEEGVAPDTIALMQPAAMKFSMGRGDTKKKDEKWSQEIWVMIQDDERGRKVISAWRYPGMSKVRSGIALQVARQEYDEFIKGK
jgi:hypothetical protein